MDITLTPTQTEYIGIEHHRLGATWAMQFPEAIEAGEGTVKAWPGEPMAWRSLGDGAWGYTWEGSPEYVGRVLAKNLKTSDGRPQYHTFAPARLETRMAVVDGGLSLTLTLTNTGPRPLTGVRSEGGCLQAKSASFRDGDEVARSHVCVGGAMVSMAGLDRTNPIRCLYVTDPARETDRFAWFWGKTRTFIDHPAIVGAVSCDGRSAIALGYGHAREALQNADDHHCLHSGPWFGDIAPGHSVTRRGWILFGDNIHALGQELARRLADG